MSEMMNRQNSWYFSRMHYEGLKIMLTYLCETTVNFEEPLGWLDEGFIDIDEIKQFKKKYEPANEQDALVKLLDKYRRESVMRSLIKCFIEYNSANEYGDAFNTPPYMWCVFRVCGKKAA